MAFSIDEIFTRQVGALGRWQWKIFILVTVATCSPLLHFSQLANLTPPYYCAQPGLEADGWSQEAIENATIPPCEGETQPSSPDVSFCDACHSFSVANATLSAPRANNSDLDECQHGWSYRGQASSFRYSLIEEYDLVCSRRYLVVIPTMAYMAGMFIGYSLGGYLGDRYGRQRMCVVSCACTCLVSIAASLSVSIWMFIGFRAVIGCVMSFGHVSSYVLCAEVTNAKHRNTYNFLFHFTNDVIMCNFGVVMAYATQHWRYYHAAAACPTLLGIAMFLFVPESPRWLVSVGRREEAEMILLRAASLNGKKLRLEELSDEMGMSRLNASGATKERSRQAQDEREDPDGPHQVIVTGADSAMDGQPGQGHRWSDIFTSQQFRLKTAALSILWFTAGLNYYGLVFFTVRLRGNPYLIAFIGNVLAMPVGIIKTIVYMYFDRHRPLVVALIGGCIFSSAGVAVRMLLPNHVSNVVMATIALAFSSATFMMAYTVTPEQYPTVYRNTATGFLSSVARAGSMVGMFVERCDEFFFPAMPMIIFSLLFALSAVMMLLVRSKKTEKQSNRTAMPDSTRLTSTHGETDGHSV